MDLRRYYQQLRDIEASIADEHVVVVSNATPDGGKAGVLIEVPRQNAAKQIVDGRARLASAEESERYYKSIKEARTRAEQASAVERMQVAVISEAELRGLRDRARQKG